MAEHDKQKCSWLMRFMPSGLEWLEGHTRLACHQQRLLANVVAYGVHHMHSTSRHSTCHPLLLNGHVNGSMTVLQQRCCGLMRCMLPGLERLEGHTRLVRHRQSPLASVVAAAEHPRAPPLDAYA